MVSRQLCSWDHLHFQTFGCCLAGGWRDRECPVLKGFVPRSLSANSDLLRRKYSAFVGSFQSTALSAPVWTMSRSLICFTGLSCASYLPGCGGVCGVAIAISCNKTKR